MGNKLVFSNDLRQKLESVSTIVGNEWNAIGVSNTLELMDKVMEKINLNYPKIRLTNYEFREVVEVYQQSSTYFGIVENEKDIIIAYVFIIPPKYETRSGVLAQQVFPVLSGIIPHLNSSNSFELTNRPIFVVNINEANHTPSMAVNILSGSILGFRYIDLYERDLNQILLNEGVSPIVRNIEDYDNLLTRINKQNSNEFFSLDLVSKEIMFLKTRLKDGINVNNEPYWFVLKAYTSLYLAVKENYKVDMSEINLLNRGNKTLDSFRDYVAKIC